MCRSISNGNGEVPFFDPCTCPLQLATGALSPSHSCSLFKTVEMLLKEKRWVGLSFFLRSVAWILISECFLECASCVFIACPPVCIPCAYLLTMGRK